MKVSILIENQQLHLQVLAKDHVDKTLKKGDF